MQQCTVGNCFDCRDNYQVCARCDVGNGWYLDNNVCKTVGMLALNQGLNPTEGKVYLCTSSGCINCIDLYTACNQCDHTNGYYLDGTNCKQKPQFSPGQGVKSTDWTVAFCDVTNCVNCVDNYLTCLGCDTVTGWFLDGNTCKTKQMFLPNQGVEISTNKVVSCLLPTCTNCIDNHLMCIGCNVQQDLYLYQATTEQQCLLKNNFPPSHGVRLTDRTVQPCVDPNCLWCIDNILLCSKCDTSKSFYLQNEGCKSKENFLSSEGADTTQGTVKNCTDVNCVDCRDEFSVCVKCNRTGDKWYLWNRTCVEAKNVSSRWGFDAKNGTVVLCQDPHCINCLNNYQICTECDQANGYILDNGQCKFLRLEADIRNGSSAGISAGLSFEIRVLSASGDVLTQVLKEIQNSSTTIVYSFKSIDSNNAEHNESCTYSAVREAGQTAVSLSISFKDKYLPDKKYNVSVSLLSRTFSYNNTEYIISSATGSTEYTNPIDKSQAETLKQQQSVAAQLGLAGSTDTAAGASITLALLALDPTGTFFRFTKILQIVNKLYFININYGKRLEAFLAKSAYAIKDDKRTQVYHSTSTRGKLTAQMVPLDSMHESIRWKVILYWTSWIAVGVKTWLMKYTDAGYRKWMLYFCHYANKAHLVIFNLVFIDFIWLAPRTLLHSHNLSVFRYIAALLTATLIMADYWIMYSKIVHRSAWLFLHDLKTPQYTWINNGDKSTPDTNQPQTKQINYKKTLLEIDFNVHLMDMASSNLAPGLLNKTPTLVKLLVTSSWMRVPVIQLLVSTTQYARQLGLTVYLLQEIARLFATIYAYLKYKYLKNIICLLMEVSQSIFMIAFTSLALLISPKRFDEPVIDFYQDAGIWIVICSCVAEYLLLITYITVAAYEFIKNRNMMKKMNVKLSPVSFIKYYETIEEYDSSSASAVGLKAPASPVNYQQAAPPEMITRINLHPGPSNQIHQCKKKVFEVNEGGKIRVAQGKPVKRVLDQVKHN